MAFQHETQYNDNTILNTIQANLNTLINDGRVLLPLIFPSDGGGAYYPAHFFHHFFYTFLNDGRVL